MTTFITHLEIELATASYAAHAYAQAGTERSVSYQPETLHSDLAYKEAFRAVRIAHILRAERTADALKCDHDEDAHASAFVAECRPCVRLSEDHEQGEHDGNPCPVCPACPCDDCQRDAGDFARCPHAGSGSGARATQTLSAFQALNRAQALCDVAEGTATTDDPRLT